MRFANIIKFSAALLLATVFIATASSGNAGLYVMSVTNTTIELMFHVSGAAPGMGSNASTEYMINGVVVSPEVVRTENHLNVNGSYVQVVTVPATGAAGRFMTASLHHPSGSANALPIELPKRAFSREHEGHTYYSETQNGTAYAMSSYVMLDHYGNRAHYGPVACILGKNDIKTSFYNGWPLWSGGTGALEMWVNAKPLASMDFIEVSFYLYNPTNTTASNARIAMYGDIKIGDDDRAPVDPLHDVNTGEQIGFTMTSVSTGKTLVLINPNANRYGSETAPNEWGPHFDLSIISKWDDSAASNDRLQEVDCGAIARVRDISVPGGALHIYTFYIGTGDVHEINDQIDNFHSVTGITGVPAETITNIPLLITGTAIPASATNRDITWSIVSDGGTGARLDGVTLCDHSQPGTVTIRATVANGIAAGRNYEEDFLITVTPPPYNAVTDIRGVPTEMVTGDSLYITGTVYPSTAASQTIIWSMTDNGGTHATFTANSMIHYPLLPGTITMRATVVDGVDIGIHYVQDFYVTVTPSPGNSVMLIIGVPTETTVNTPLPITGMAIPVTINEREIIWSMDNNGNTGAALNDENVLVNASTPGYVTIEGRIVDGIEPGMDYVQYFTIAVNPIPVEDINNVPNQTTAGIPLTLTGTVSPESATNQTIIWSILDAGIANGRITDGNVLQTSGGGTVIVRAVIANGIRLDVDFTKDFTVEVTRIDMPDWTFDLPSVTYNGQPQGIPAPQPPEGVTEHGAVSVLYNGVDSIPVNAGTYTVSLNVAESPLYNAISVELGEFTINPKQLPDAPLSVETQLYKGVGVTPSVTIMDTIMDGAVELADGIDYTLTYENNVAIGDGATVTATGIGNYDGKAFGTFTIIRGRGARLSAGPNPTRRRSNGTNFYWQGYNVRYGVLRIYDAQGNFVNSVEITDSVFNNHESRIVGAWDLTNRAGRLVRAGVYLVRGTFDTAEGRRENVFLLIGVGE